MSDATKHLANSILYKLHAKVGAPNAQGEHPLHVNEVSAPNAPMGPASPKLPHHVLKHAIEYIDKIKVSKRGMKPL